MHVVILTSFFYPLVNGVTVRVYKDALALKECGHKVTIVSPFSGRSEFDCIKAGDSVFFVGAKCVSVLRELHKKDPVDVIISQNMVTNVIAHRALVKKYKVAHICQVHGPEMKEITAAVRNPLKLLVAHFLSLLDRRAMKKAREIIVVETEIEKWLEKKYGQKNKSITHIANYPDLGLFKPKSPKVQNQFTCGFLGTLQPGRIDPLLELTKRMTDIDFMIVGKGECEEEIRKNYSDTVTLTSEDDYLKVPDVINKFDLGIIFSLQPKGMSDKGPPMKLFEYLACGVPVLAVNLWNLQEFVEGAGIGEVVSIDDMEKGINKIKSNYDGYQKNILKFINRMQTEFSWDNEIKKLCQLVNKTKPV